MKTLTITWISYNNYGTLLQAYALQQKLEQLGCSNTILYDAEALNRQFAGKDYKKPQPDPQTLTEKLIRLLRTPGRLTRRLSARFDMERYKKPYHASWDAMEDFRAQDLKIHYGASMDELEQLDLEYDAYVCGSDQVWSVHTNMFNPFYYLNFTAKPRIAYAPSMGTDNIPPETADEIRELLQDFTAVSVREETCAQRLREITGRDVSWVLDPTLLHRRSFWEQFSDGVQIPNEKYLLCYFLGNRPWYFDYAQAMARKLKLKLLLIPSTWDYLQYPFTARFGVGPREFVALFRNAAFVLTDSYHGSIFSTIFEREFLYLQRFRDDDPRSQNIRVESLFGGLGLSQRIVSTDTKPTRPAPIDYRAVNKKLAAMRRFSEDYLKTSLDAAENS